MGEGRELSEGHRLNIASNLRLRYLEVFLDSMYLFHVDWMKERLWRYYQVLKDTGSMYLHCDWSVNHRLRLAMDEIFGEKSFQNDII